MAWSLVRIQAGLLVRQSQSQQQVVKFLAPGGRFGQVRLPPRFFGLCEHLLVLLLVKGEVSVLELALLDNQLALNYPTMNGPIAFSSSCPGEGRMITVDEARTATRGDGCWTC